MDKLKLELVMLIRFFIYPFIVLFRDRARHVVYNFELEQGIFNYNLLRTKLNVVQKHEEVPNGKNYLKYEEIPIWKYLAYKWLVWIYLDDSCDLDTFYINDLSNLKYDIHYICNDVEIGSSWIMGDARQLHSCRNFRLEWLVVCNYKRLNYYYIKSFVNKKTINSKFIGTVMYKDKRVDVYAKKT